MLRDICRCFFFSMAAPLFSRAMLVCFRVLRCFAVDAAVFRCLYFMTLPLIQARRRGVYATHVVMLRSERLCCPRLLRGGVAAVDVFALAFFCCYDFRCRYCLMLRAAFCASFCCHAAAMSLRRCRELMAVSPLRHFSPRHISRRR